MIKVHGKSIKLVDVPGLNDLRMPLPVWLSQYGQMPAEQKKVTKLLWVIKPTVRPDASHRMTRDIISSMFDTAEDFASHVVIVFSFWDKSPLDEPEEWIKEVCQR